MLIAFLLLYESSYTVREPAKNPPLMAKICFMMKEKSIRPILADKNSVGSVSGSGFSWRSDQDPSVLVRSGSGF